MKKIILIITSLLLALPLFSCEKNLINDADTGEIILTENKYSYTDGTYYSAYDYFDSDGYCAVMKMDINGGIIKNVRFDYFAKDNTPFSEISDGELYEKVVGFRSIRKSLYTQTLAAQSLTGINYSQSDRFSVDYLSLANEILYSAKNQGEKIIIKESVNTYESQDPLTDNIFASLAVTYVSDDISQIDFDITDADGSSLALDGATCMEVLGLSSEQTSQIISVLEEVTDKQELKKENTEESLNTIFDVYNSMAEEIQSSRLKAQFSYNKLF